MLINIKKEKVEEKIVKIIETLLQQRVETIIEEYGREKEKIDKSFLLECQKFFEVCKLKQDIKKEEIIYFINFNYLRWAVIEEAIELQMTAYGEKYYLGNETCYRAWRPIYINKCFQQDLEEFQQQAKKIWGYTMLDYDKAKNEFSNFYYMVLGMYCKKMCEQIVELEGYEKLIKGGNCKMVFGGYMDKGVTFYPISKEEK